MITTGQKIAIRRTENSRLPGTDLDNIKFGRVFSDHMVVMDHVDGSWGAPSIVPFEKLSMSPASLVLHYGQSIFEGLKAYRSDDGSVNVFRPQANIARMNRSAQRMCMPQVPEDLFLETLIELLKVDQAWIPGGDEAALYIRPFMYASDEFIGVRPSDTYKFMIFTCPVRGYYKEPVRVRVETDYSRAFPGGTGATKCAGNYSAALYPAKLAQEQGFHQLIWTDAMTHRYIEESGTMNVFFVVDGKLLTPETSGTILEGVTRDSLIQLAERAGRPIDVRQVSVEEIRKSLEEGRLTEAFGAGTAATIAHISAISIGGEEFSLPPIEQRIVALALEKELDDIRRGRADDPYGWLVQVPA
ncbi:MAG: branched-chain amino acid aminotransferase [Flavobacteriales bacterium]|nr:branched-chain amino acid aminotransferase [Flavobacteriales bacterium]